MVCLKLLNRQKKEQKFMLTLYYGLVLLCNTALHLPPPPAATA